SDGSAPYALMVFAGVLPWSYFSSLERYVHSLLSNEQTGQQLAEDDRERPPSSGMVESAPRRYRSRSACSAPKHRATQALGRAHGNATGPASNDDWCDRLR